MCHLEAKPYAAITSRNQPLSSLVLTEDPARTDLKSVQATKQLTRTSPNAIRQATYSP